MDIWNDYVLPELLKRARIDEDYQNMLKENARTETAYCEVMDRQKDADRVYVDAYIASCEDLGYRLAQLAYELGASSYK